MKAILVRIGIDHSYGKWNAPANPHTREFVYTPIPESAGTQFHPGCKRSYAEFVPTLNAFAANHGLDLVDDLNWPVGLESRAMHLDPDFEYLTYGDDGARRGSDIRELIQGDLVVFYAGLKSIDPTDDQLIYALIGMLVVKEVVKASSVIQGLRHQNAHTRKTAPGKADIVVRGMPGKSGRFTKLLPIGEYRKRAYRVKENILKEWGELSVNDGYIQRSARPPAFLNPKKFLSWLNKQDFSLVQENNPGPATPSVILVHLRQPRMGDPNEMRSDPFWEFGSFGCTGCHSKNLMHLARVHELEGARLGFAQGGPSGFRLVKLTSPITIVKHKKVAETRWHPPGMPYRYDSAPLLIDNRGKSDFPLLRKIIASAQRSSWMGRFSSKFRSRRAPLPPEVAAQVISVVKNHELSLDDQAIAHSYEDALPFPPPHIDRDRERTYFGLLAKDKEHLSRRHPSSSVQRKASHSQC